MDIELNEAAVTHFFGGQMDTLGSTTVIVHSRPVGVQKVRLAGPGVSFKVTALNPSDLARHEESLHSHDRRHPGLLRFQKPARPMRSTRPPLIHTKPRHPARFAFRRERAVATDRQVVASSGGRCRLHMSKSIRRATIYEIREMDRNEFLFLQLDALERLCGARFVGTCFVAPFSNFTFFCLLSSLFCRNRSQVQIGL